MTQPTRSPRLRRAQKGQAIVLIALLMVILLGLLGLALDSGRGYVDRRELQDAADAAVLAAGDSYENFASFPAAEQLGVQVFAENERIASIGGQSYANSNPETYAFASDSTIQLTISHSVNAFGGTVFVVTPTHRIPLSVMQVLGLGSTIPVSATAQAVVGSANASPALLTLSQGGCGNNPGSSLTLQGSTTVVVHGDVYSNGTMGMGGSSSFTIGGSAYANCAGIPSQIVFWCYSLDPNQPPYQPPCIGSDSLGSGNNGAPVLPDPKYPEGNVSYYPNTYGSPGYENLPGVYTGFSITGGGGCDWLAPGVYTMAGGFTDHGHQTTNMLKPPDEPNWNNDTVRVTPQFFDPGGCAPNPGFSVTEVPASGSGNSNSLYPVAPTWGVEVTTTRTDYYPPSGQPGSVAYGRESAPSMCRPITLNNGAGKGAISVGIARMPGATGYNIYLSPNGCATTADFGFVQSISGLGGLGTCVNTGPVAEKVGGTTCTPNAGVPILDKASIGNGFTPANAQCPYTVPATSPFLGCLAPDSESAPYNSPSAILTTGLASGSSYTQIPVDNTLGLTAAGIAVVLSTGDSTTQTVTVAAGSSSTVLNVIGFTANAAYPANTSIVSVTNSLANESPAKGLYPHGDRANENQCWPQTNGTATNPCNSSAVTPGAVQFAFPTASDCLDENGNGGTEVFGGRQYDFILLWFSQTNNCSPKLNGGSFTQYIGTMYMPAANLTINGGNKAPVAGQVIAYTAYFSGNSGISIDYNPDTAPAPPSALLIF